MSQVSGDEAKPNPSPPPPASPDHPIFLKITNVTKNITEDHLNEIFTSFGQVHSTAVRKHLRFGYITGGRAYVAYLDPTHADKALDYMNGGQIDGAVVAVEKLSTAPNMHSPSPPPRRDRGIDNDVARGRERGRYSRSPPPRRDARGGGRRGRSYSRSPPPRRPVGPPPPLPPPSYRDVGDRYGGGYGMYGGDRYGGGGGYDRYGGRGGSPPRRGDMYRDRRGWGDRGGVRRSRSPPRRGGGDYDYYNRGGGRGGGAGGGGRGGGPPYRYSPPPRRGRSRSSSRSPPRRERRSRSYSSYSYTASSSRSRSRSNTTSRSRSRSRSRSGRSKSRSFSYTSSEGGEKGRGGVSEQGA